MAEKKKRDFKLGKKGSHNFDLKKRETRNFDLSKDDDDVVVEEVAVAEVADAAPTAAPAATAPQTAASQKPSSPSQKPSQNAKPEEKKQDAAAAQPRPDAVIPPADFGDTDSNDVKKTNWWVWILGVCIIIGLVIWLFCNMHWKAEHQGESVAEEEQQIQNTYNVDQAEDEAPEVVETLPDEVVTAPAEGENAEASAETAQQPEAQQPTQQPEAAPASPAVPATPATPTTPATPVAPATPASTTIPATTATTASPIAPAPVANIPAEQVDVETEAHNVMSGSYGNGEERKQRLGKNYRMIQDRVNEKIRNGEF